MGKLYQPLIQKVLLLTCPSENCWAVVMGKLYQPLIRRVAIDCRVHLKLGSSVNRVIILTSCVQISVLIILPTWELRISGYGGTTLTSSRLLFVTVLSICNWDQRGSTVPILMSICTPDWPCLATSHLSHRLISGIVKLQYTVMLCQITTLSFNNSIYLIALYGKTWIKKNNALFIASKSPPPLTSCF